MFKVARELLREDGQKVSMSVDWEETKVVIRYSLAGSEEVTTTTYTPFEAGMLLDMLHIADEHADTLSD